MGPQLGHNRDIAGFVFDPIFDPHWTYCPPALFLLVLFLALFLWSLLLALLFALLLALLLAFFGAFFAEGLTHSMLQCNAARSGMVSQKYGSSN